MRSPSGRLLETEGWLALGVPALRSVTWRRWRSPQFDEGIRRPNAIDLLPLIASEPDPRTDQLKQWIVNIDYRIKSGAAAGQGTDPSARSRYVNLLDEFFMVINRLTGSLPIQFKEVDANRGHVLVETDDGVMPLEALSQGTVSLLGWIGVLMQRLYEVYYDEDEPRNQFALVPKQA